ncbi:MAG: hypothetical protein NT007_03205 [Candidatus Kapabacteria bacterium]|nr:hypothetical protein [Candidatus Kapabacteria bacterium]
MNFKYILIIFSCCMIFNSACKSDQKKENLPVNDFQIGIIVDNIKINANSSESFCVYLPEQYKVQKDLPLMIFLDPKAAGVRTLRKYSALAEKYGYIFVASNFSRNGIAYQLIEQHIDKLIEKINNVISYDRKRIYMAGFSGGARVAQTYATNNSSIVGIIMCSAGFAEDFGANKLHYDLFAIAGFKDFNYNEIVGLELNFPDSVIEHHFSYFSDKHKWPPIVNIDEALLFFSLGAMKKNLISKNQILINNEINLLNAKIQRNQENNALTYKNLALYEKMIHFFGGLFDMNEYKILYDELKNTKEIKDYVKKRYDLIAVEDKMKSYYVEKIQTENTKWWIEEIAKINKSIISSKDENDSLMKLRVLGYMSLVSFMASEQALNQKNIPASEHFITIYKLVDEINPDYNYLLARLAMLKGDEMAAIKQIGLAIEKGFEEPDKLRNTKVFGDLTNKPEWLNLIKSIKE